MTQLLFPFLLLAKCSHDMLLNQCFWFGGILLTLLLMSFTSQCSDMGKLRKEIRETLAQGYKTDAYIMLFARNRGLWGFLVLAVMSYGFQWQVQHVDQFFSALLCMLLLLYGLTTYLFEWIFLRMPAQTYLQPKSGAKMGG